MPQANARRLVAIVIAGLLLGACGATRHPLTADGTTTSMPVTVSRAVPDSTTSSAVAAPSAHDQLLPFVEAARALDAHLKAAARAINGTGPPWLSVSPQIAAAVTSADLEPVAASIPAGIDGELRGRVILVYSELVSRRYALRDFAFVTDLSERSQDQLLQDVGHGQEAASRFPGDLIDLEAEATASAPLVIAAPTSHAAAETLLLVSYVNGQNGGCGGTGGQIVDVLPEIVWRPFDLYGTAADGTIGGTPFVASAVAGMWMVTIWAC